MKLHKDIVGTEWISGAPRFLEWAAGKRTDRIKSAIAYALLKGRAKNADKLNAGEKASLLMPYVLMKDNTAKNRLGFFRPYPIHYGFIERAITAKDIDEWNKKHPQD